MVNLHRHYLEAFKMGTAKFFYVPMPNGSFLQEIDLGEALGELSSGFYHDAVDNIGYNGGIRRSVTRGNEIINIQRDRMQLGERLANKFDALQNHLDRGYSVSFCADSDKCWSAFCRRSPSSGDQVIEVNDNIFKDWTGVSTIPATGDYLVIETPSPKYVREIVYVRQVESFSSLSGGRIILDTGERIQFHYRSRPAFVRHYRWWPILKREQSEVGKPIITNEGGRLWSLNITLVPDYEELFVLYNGEDFGGDEITLISPPPTSGPIENTEGETTPTYMIWKNHEDNETSAFEELELDPEFDGDFREER